MIPTHFKEENFTFTKPESMDDNECGPLPVHKGEDTDGYPVIISSWQLTPEEMEEIKTTGKVWLVITGTRMPPVNIRVATPFKYIET